MCHISNKSELLKIYVSVYLVLNYMRLLYIDTHSTLAIINYKSEAPWLAAVVAAVIFKPGEEYVYHYKGHVLSGIPKTSDQYAGLLIDTIVRLQFQQDYKVVMKVSTTTKSSWR